ncbi:DALR anticodon-binding domain-containing protein 3 isoform X2 [Castor canadensis]|uniref:DALR anticodon-binding domain-containing protein 3 isoform X2 n=1 Tax=Castor canadensis TaxID=51338 RepID=A0AC58LCX3_CASCN
MLYFLFRSLLPVVMATGRLGVGEILEALNAALGPGDPVWFKETHARHLRVRDFLAPRRALQARFRDGQVPEHVFRAVACLQGPGVAPVLRCEPTPSGLSLQLQRTAVFERVLGAVTSYATPAKPASSGPRMLLHCPALHCSPGALRLSQLRAVLVADHLARALCAHGVCVRLVPPVWDPHMQTFLEKLRVDWPTALERTSTETLRSRVLTELTPVHDGETLPPGVLGRLCLKELMEELGRGTGYDPNVDNCLVTEDLLSVLAELQEAVRHWREGSYSGLVSGSLFCGPVANQKHLVCGPVKIAGALSTLMTAPEYYKLRHAQMCKASALKHGGDLIQDPIWTEIFGVLSAATIKFEMLSTAAQSQLLLTDSSISTKGTKSGTFVMYNCARLATLFESYKHSMEQGLYPTFPPVNSLDFSLLHDEGEWLLLFNSVLPFLDLLSQTAVLASRASGFHITARTEMVCKFLVQLSMDFSSYYNRVHILGEPRPHLFGQMFARLQLLRAVREVLHTGLALLGLPPLSHM